jgi:hypothetical protein
MPVESWSAFRASTTVPASTRACPSFARRADFPLPGRPSRSVVELSSADTREEMQSSSARASHRLEPSVVGQESSGRDASAKARLTAPPSRGSGGDGEDSGRWEETSGCNKSTASFGRLYAHPGHGTSVARLFSDQPAGGHGLFAEQKPAMSPPPRKLN